MIDYSYLHAMPAVKKTPEEMHNSCAWCRSDPTKVNATQCMCLRPCGKPLCVQDVEEFQMPSIPRFL